MAPERPRYIVEPHSDFSIEWEYNFADSIACKASGGRIAMKYSSIPQFLYILAKSLDDFNFLGKARAKILDCEIVGFANLCYIQIF